MAKTVTTTTTLELVLRRAEVTVTAVGYRLVYHCHEVEYVNGNPVGTTNIKFEAPVSAALAAEIDKVLEAKRAEHYA